MVKAPRKSYTLEFKHAVVEQVFGPQLGIGMNQHPVGGLALAGMTCHGVAVVKVRILQWIDLDAVT
jgi:hypothetical protein